VPRNAPVLKHIDDGVFGDLALMQSRWSTDRKWTEVNELTPSKIGQRVWVRGRVHRVRPKAKLAFVLLRHGFSSVQIVVDVNAVSPELLAYVSKLSAESIIDVYAQVVKAQSPVLSASQSDVELILERVYGVSISESVLPFQLDDAARGYASKERADDVGDKKEEKKAGVVTVGQDIRLDNRVMDIRTPAQNAIMRIQAAITTYFRDYFSRLEFVEIHSPKLLAGSSEGGANVFTLKYFGKNACLAQSPQLYKQMAVMSDLFKVYEIGPVFRAEDSNTHRHMTEFTGLDFEMAFKEHYHEVLSILANLFVFVFENINEHHQAELKVIRQQYPVEPLKFSKNTLVFEFEECVEMLKEWSKKPNAASYTRDMKNYIIDGDDFSTGNEKLLGKIVKEKFDTDFYIVDKYRQGARPFYTMPDPNRPGYSNSYDVFLRGEEITSGAQRIHDVELLKKRAEDCKIPVKSIQKYIDSFSYGAFPHAGAGIGLERTAMLFLGLDNIRKSSLFPRDPKRLEP